MPLLNVRASTVVDAPAPVVYELIADYRNGHPTILPPQYFSDLVVEEGGRGAGTRIRFTVKAFGSSRVARARITEPEPGHILVETDPDNGTVTRFIVDPIAPDKTMVTFDTKYVSTGVRSLIERFLVPPFLSKVYAAELALLAQRAAERTKVSTNTN